VYKKKNHHVPVGLPSRQKKKTAAHFGIFWLQIAKEYFGFTPKNSNENNGQKKTTFLEKTVQ